MTMAVLTICEEGRFQIERISLDAGRPPDLMPDPQRDLKQIVICVMQQTEKGKPVEQIARHCKISLELAEQICRLYVTHPGVTADGILGKMGF